MKQLLDGSHFRSQLDAGEPPLTLFKAALREGTRLIEKRFDGGEPITNLISLRARLMDFLLGHAWALLVPEKGQRVLSLVAVGGYGRGELHPCSDIDLLVLLGEGGEEEAVLEGVADFIRFLWDIGLEVGHSVRTLPDCVERAANDLTIATNLLESRSLAGEAQLYHALRRAMQTDQIWPSDQFFAAKAEEQRKRHARLDPASNLEPNIKECPGGLRDIQMIGWVVKRHFGGDSFHDLLAHNFLSEREYRALMEGQGFLWRIRFALHTHSKTHEDRLLFDHQRTLAERFGYQDDEQSLGVEKFMQEFYRTLTQLQMLNERLLQLFDEATLQADRAADIQPLNRRFQAHNGYIELRNDVVFQKSPFALLELFLLLQQNPQLKGVRASTIRQVRFNRHRVDLPFRQDLRARTLFMEILRQPHHVDRELRRMSRYGILGLYLPAFGKIIGRMQFDLFHMYTVDEHTFQLIRNLHHFTLPEKASEFPVCSEIMGRIPKRELLYLGGLFHDIAKGRGGSHPQLGAVDALEFCRLHDLPKWDSELVAWLVENHLRLSMVAQRQDINDPEVVHAFAERMRDPIHLDYLYLLTVADVRATDPNKWNSWKDSLLRELYFNTRRALQKGLSAPSQMDELVGEQQREALQILAEAGIESAPVLAFWDELNPDYFLQFSPQGLAWHVQKYLEIDTSGLPIVRVRRETVKGGSEVLIIGRDRDYLFADSTCLLDRLNLNVVNARIETEASGITIDSFKVLETDGELIADEAREREIIDTMEEVLRSGERPEICINRRLSRQLRYFEVATEIEYSDDPTHQRTIMKLVTADRPGLLAKIGDVFFQCGVHLHSAKIATIGASAEDTFFITDREGRPLEKREQFDCIERQILGGVSTSAR